MKTTKLKNGARIKAFTSVDANGKKFSFGRVKTDYVLLAFLRYAGCPFCNLSVHRLAMEHKLLLDSRCDIVAFIQSNPEQIQKNIYARHQVQPKFPILPDQEMKLYKEFGVRPNYKNTGRLIKNIPYWVHSVRHHGFAQAEIDGSLFIAPAMFLIHVPTMQIVIADYQSDLFSHETFSPIYDKILTHSQ